MLPRSILCHAAKLAPVVLTCALAADVAWCARAELMGAKISLDEPGEPPGLFVEAHYEFDLPTPLINAMHRGIALYFAYSFELTKSRWYWLDKEVASSTFTIRLAFNPLTRRYAVSYSGYSLNFDSLEEALPYIKNIRRWRVAGAGDAKPGTTAELRFGLDVGKLPKPMQVTNQDTDDWNVVSDPAEIPIPTAVMSAAAAAEE